MSAASQQPDRCERRTWWGIEVEGGARNASRRQVSRSLNLVERRFEGDAPA